MRPIKPRENKPSKFHYAVYKKLERWKKKQKIEIELDYAPNLGKAKTHSFRPDIIVDIKRDPNEMLYFENDNTIDLIEGYLTEGKKFKIKVILDATIWEGKNSKKWLDRIERMKNMLEPQRKKTNGCMMSSR